MLNANLSPFFNALGTADLPTSGSPGLSRFVEPTPALGAFDPNTSALSLLQRAQALESQSLGIPNSPPTRPAYRTQDLVTGALPALGLALLGGKGGGQAAGEFIKGYLQGKALKADEDTDFARRETDWKRAQLAHDASVLRENANYAQVQANQAQQERLKYLGLAQTIMSDMDRLTVGNASMVLGRLRAVAAKAGMPELAPTPEEESDLVAGLMSASNRTLAAKMVPGLLTSMRSNGVPSARVTAGMMLLGIFRKFPDLSETFAVDPLDVAKELHALGEFTPRENAANASANKSTAQTETVNALRNPLVKKAQSEAEMAAVRAQYLPKTLQATLDRAEASIDRTKQSMQMADSRFQMAMVKDRRQALKMIMDAGKDLPKLRGLKATLESEYRVLRQRLQDVENGRFQLPFGLTRDDAMQQLRVAMQKNEDKRKGIDVQAANLLRNSQSLKQFMRGLPATSNDEFQPAQVDLSGGLPPAGGQVRLKDPADLAGAIPWGGGGAVAQTAAKASIAAERKQALEALKKYKDPRQQAAIKAAFKKRTGQDL